MSMKKVRNSNLELLRIISMVLIILGHITWETNWQYSNISTIKFLPIQTLWIGGKLGVNLFILISAFFLSKRTEFKLKPLIKLWLTVITYSWLILIISLIFKNPELSIHNILRNVFPIGFDGYWFITAYFFTYLIAPLLNKFLLSLEDKDYALLLIVGFVLLFIFGPLLRNKTAGSGDTWITVVYVYVVGAAIRRYDIVNFFKNKKKLLTGIAIINVLIMIMSIWLMDIFENGGTFFYVSKGYARFVMGNSPFQLILSICIFLIFTGTQVAHNRIINYTATGTLGVYMIHTNVLLKGIIFNGILEMQKYQNSNFVLIRMFVYGLLLFLVLILVDLLRQIVSKNFEEKLSDYMTQKINDVLKKITGNYFLRDDKSKVQ